MSILLQYFVRIVLLSVVIAVAGCSWPSVKVGDEKYLIGPTPVNEKRQNTSPHP